MWLYDTTMEEPASPSGFSVRLPAAAPRTHPVSPIRGGDGPTLTRVWGGGLQILKDNIKANNDKIYNDLKGVRTRRGTYMPSHSARGFRG